MSEMRGRGFCVFGGRTQRAGREKLFERQLPVVSFQLPVEVLLITS
jgi:hypothetical protein